MSEAPPYPATDQLDRAIAGMLAQDARLSFRRIAAELGVTEGTVRGRVKRLQAAGLLRLVPIVDIARARDPGAPQPAGSGQLMMFVTVKCVSGKLEQVRDGLLAMERVRALYDANAALRLVAVCLVAGLEEAAQVTDAVLALDGMREAETELVLQTVKYNAAIAPIATVEAIRSMQLAPAVAQGGPARADGQAEPAPTIPDPVLQKSAQAQRGRDS